MSNFIILTLVLFRQFNVDSKKNFKDFFTWQFLAPAKFTANFKLATQSGLIFRDMHAAFDGMSPCRQATILQQF